MPPNPYDYIVGGAIFAVIALLVYRFLWRDARYSIKARLAWSAWLAAFPLLEFYFEFDGDPSTPTLSELGVANIGAQWMVRGTVVLAVLLIAHWPDVAGRLWDGVAKPPRFQFVNWFPEWQGIQLFRLDPKDTYLAYIYDWCFYFGWFEIRKWSERKVPDREQ